ncbi:MAG: hypothetical protein WAM11_02855 [Cyanobium sp.]
MAAYPWLNQLCRHGATGLSGVGLALLFAPALQASPSATITASGTVPETASVEVPSNAISLPPVLSSDGSAMTVALRDPVQINANVLSQVQLSPVQLVAPQGVTSGAVGADINLSANGSLLIGATTSGGATVQIPVGSIATSVSARFYSTTTQPLPAGTYTASTVISVLAD